MSSKISFRDLERDPFFANCIKLIEARHGPLTDDLKACLVDMAGWADIVPKQHVEWILDLLRIVESMNKAEPAPSDYGLFWIRLHGLLTEVADYFAPGKLPINQDRLWIAACERIARIKSAFTEEEILWIEHERMCHCHPAPGYYRKSVRMKENGKFAFKNDFKGRPLDKLNDALKSVIAPHLGDSRPLAREFALRVAADLKILNSAAQAWAEQVS
jgi:hypothetical protein